MTDIIATIAIALCLVAPLACRTEAPPATADAKAGAARADSDAPAPTKADAEPDPATKPSQSVIGMLQEARAETACNDLMMIRAAVEMFTLTKGECPPDLAALEAERVIDRVREDPWGNAYQLQCSELELRCAGPDGEHGTPDDIVLGATGDACTPK